MNKKKLLIYLFIFLAVDSAAVLNINNIKNINIYKNIFQNSEDSIGNEENLQVKLFSSVTIDSTWIVIDTTVVDNTTLDVVINEAIGQGKTKFYIKDGVYNLNNSINVNLPNIIIQGESKENTIIRQLNAGKNTIEVTADYVQVSNLTIDNTQDQIAFMSKNSNNVTLEDCIIHGSPTNSAIAFWGITGVDDITTVENNVLSSNNIIQRNTIYSNPSGTLDGLIFMKQKYGIIKNNTMIGSRIAFYLCRNSEVSFNTSKNSSTNGIRCTVPAYDNKIFNNTIENSLGSGICVVRNDNGLTPSSYRASNIEISNNTIHNSRYFGIEISNLKDSIITNNIIDSIDFSGIYLLYADTLNVSQNKIYNTGLATAANGRNLWGWNESLNSGIFLDYAVCNSLLDNNIITNNYNNCLHGIRMQSGGSNLNNSITYNTISGNFSTGIAANVGAPESPDIHDNVINLNSMSAPTNLTAIPTATDITLSWDSVASATEYEVEVDLNGNVTLISNIVGTSYVNTGLTNNTSYKYRVRASGGNWSNFMTTTTLEAVLPPTPVIIPAPTNLTAIPTVSDITLNWDSVTGATEYEVEVDLNGTVTLISNIAGTSYVNTGLTSNTDYKYRVRASGGNWSNFMTATTLQAVLPPTPVIIPAPTNLIAVPTVDDITLSWDSVTGATEYEVEVEVDLNGNVTLISNIAGTSYVHTGLTSSTDYKYRVRANGGNWSNFMTATTLEAVSPPDPVLPPTPVLPQDPEPVPPTPVLPPSDPVIIPTPSDTTTGAAVIITATPTNITTVSSVNSITISWDDVTGATGYEIEINGHIINNGTSTFYVNAGLKSNSKYKFRVKSIGGNWSKFVTAKNLPKPTTKHNPGKIVAEVPVVTIPVPPKVTDPIPVVTIPVPPKVTDPIPVVTIPVPPKVTNPIPVGTIPTPTSITTVSSVDNIKISWNSVAGATGYEIEINGVILNNGTNTNYVNTNLISNKSYKYRVRVIDGNWSNFVVANTLSVSLPPLNPAIMLTLTLEYISNPMADTITLPQAPESTSEPLENLENLEKPSLEPIQLGIIPTNIKVIPQSDSITISWDEVLDVDGYEIEADGKIIDMRNNTSYVATGLMSNTHHSYRVRVKGMEWSENINIETLSNNDINQTKESNVINSHFDVFDFMKNMSVYKLLTIVITLLLMLGVVILIKFL